jgi:phospholipid/cholesterol/gamma-HCH transport system substrate-binding protein
MKKMTMEFFAGLFLIVGIVALAYLSVKLGKLEYFGNKDFYSVIARFGNVGGLKVGTVVEIAGVEVGRVRSVALDNYEAKVEMLIEPGVKLQDDSIASIRSKGLVGDIFVTITPGGSEEFIKPSGFIRETESFVSINELLSKYAFGSVDKKEP